MHKNTRSILVADFNELKRKSNYKELCILSFSIEQMYELVKLLTMIFLCKMTKEKFKKRLDNQLNLWYNTSTVKVRNTTTQQQSKENVIMWSFEIQNKTTGERDIIFGYNWKDAVRRSKINEDEWKFIRQDYED